MNSISKRQWRKGIKNAICVHSNRYSVQQRLDFFPFKNASSIKVVSFEQPKGAIINLPMLNDKVDFSSLKEVRELTKDEINKLTDILFNNSFGKGNFVVDPPEGACYIPRNAILFADSNSEVFAFIELCFQCQRYRLSSDKIEIGNVCEGKYEMIKKFFADCGIKTGISGVD
ncbi:MAG: hypothetical protein JSS79_08955 [Bacteroidetes bacterium]|nr:hypothetical protein [Bacteroidota bacterium]